MSGQVLAERVTHGQSLMFYARMTGRTRVGATILAAAVALAGASVGQGGTVGSVTKVVNPQWAGYVVTAPHVAFTNVTATWRQPAVRCVRGAAPALSAVWVGLGGYASTVLEQVGVSANCDRMGKAGYFAWFELIPDTAHAIDEKVSAGDTIAASVKRLRLNLVELRIEDRTRGWTFVRRITWDASESSSAEWIVEAPYSCIRFSCHPAPLANFGSVTLRDVVAVGNGSRGTLSAPGWTKTAISLMPCASTPSGSRAGAIPGAASGDGTTFVIAWARDAGLSRTCKKLPGEALVGGLPDVTEG
jgi:hypothetical protein